MNHFKKPAYPCVWCNRSYIGIYSWAAHMTREHNEIKEVVCLNCDLEFDKPYYLKNHLLKRECLNEFPKDKCGYCDKLFTSASYRRTHEENVCLQSLVVSTGEDLFTDDQKKLLDSVKLDL